MELLVPISTTEKPLTLVNPYPSALDAVSFITNNAILDGTLYFWTHGTKIGAEQLIWDQGHSTSDDYASLT
jgi:hypothetical protein